MKNVGSIRGRRRRDSGLNADHLRGPFFEDTSASPAKMDIIIGVVAFALIFQFPLSYNATRYAESNSGSQIHGFRYSLDSLVCFREQSFGRAHFHVEPAIVDLPLVQSSIRLDRNLRLVQVQVRAQMSHNLGT